MHRREMRQADKRMSREDAYELLRVGEYGVLGLIDEEGEPYTVAMNYCLSGSTIYFHSALEGHKLDAVRHDERASFSVVTEHIVKPEDFTSYYSSVHVRGKARMVEELEEKRRALTLIAEKYSPGLEESAAAFIDKAGPSTAVFAVKVLDIQGKKNPAGGSSY